jgi:DNA-binding transcriptional LysR family regulator
MTDMVLALRTFAKVAETLNFTTVAQRSHASNTTIARRIDFLEGHFGVRLLHRTTRSLALTPEGERLLDHARAVIEEIDHAESDLAGTGDLGGVVRVGVTTALGLYYAERVIGLLREHPALRVEFAVSDWQDGLAGAGLDLALRVGDLGPEAHALGSLARVLVAAPDYLERRPALEAARDLLDHECITYGYGPSRTGWDIDDLRLKIGGSFRANSSEAVYRAVASGLGIGMLPLIKVRDDLESGRLVRILPTATIEPLVISVIDRFPNVRMPARVRAVLNFLIETFPAA